jgi:hypothetical protein
VTVIALALVYIVAMLAGMGIRRVRYHLFTLAAFAGVVALAVNVRNESWLAAGIWVLNLALVGFNWVRWRRTDAARDELDRIRSQW